VRFPYKKRHVILVPSFGLGFHHKETTKALQRLA
jgi:hypothetical protein